MRPALILALTFALAGPVAADCLTASSGAKCVTAAATEAGTEGAIRFLKAPVRPAPFGVGDILPDGYSILLNTDYYGLPPATDGWVYVRADRRLYRVDRASRAILADATGEANAAFGG